MSSFVPTRNGFGYFFQLFPNMLQSEFESTAVGAKIRFIDRASEKGRTAVGNLHIVCIGMPYHGPLQSGSYVLGSFPTSRE